MSFISDHTTAIAVIVVFGFMIWQFWIKPIMNEGKPIEPPEEEDKPSIADSIFEPLE